MNLKSPTHILMTDWDQLKIKDKGINTTYDIKKQGLINNSDGFIDSVDIKMYDHLKKVKNNKTYALILTLLFQRNITSISLKRNYIKLKFDNDQKVTIDLLSNDLIEFSDEIIELVVNSYKKSRQLIIDKAIEEDKDIYFCKTKRFESFFDKDENSFSYCTMGSINDDKNRGIDFNLEDSSFVYDSIIKFLNSCKDRVIINERIVNLDDYNISTELNFNSYNPVIVGLKIESKDKKLFISNSADYKKIKNMIKEHNEKIKVKSLGRK